MSNTATVRDAYRPAEAAERLGVSRMTIYNLINRGVIRSVKIGSARLIPASELHRILGDEVGAQS